jgi:hypothetical protein
MGLGVQPGQRVLVQAPVDTAPLARLIVREAYAAGASFVDVRWDDDDVVLARFGGAPDGTFETISQWRVDAELETANAGGAVLAIRATDPNLLGNVDQARVATYQRAWATYRRPYSQQVMTNRSKVRLADSELEAGLQRATAPLFVFSKYEEPHATLNPTVQIVLRPRPPSLGSPTALLAVATTTLKRAFADFAFVDPIQEVEVAGMKAAYMKAAYTLRTAGAAEHRVVSRTWLVPRGAFMLLIGMSGTADGADACDLEFATALNSIVIEK